MTIRFRCPNPACKKVLGVPDHLAGRKATCPACKKPLRIPTPRAAPTAAPANVEDFAAAAFADEPAAAAAEKPRTVQLECPFCAEPVEFPVEMAGKQAPCPNPECRRIVKVPALAEEKQANWRTEGRDGLRGTKENVQKVLEAQEAANIKRGVVSKGALEEAGALPSREVPLTTGEKVRLWTRRVLLTAAVVGLAVGVYVWVRRTNRESEEKGPLAEVEPWLNPKLVATPPIEDAERKKLSAELAGELYRAVGEFYARDRMDRKRSLDLAQKHFTGARASAPARRSVPPEWEILLADLAVNQIDLGGPPQEVEDKLRLDWPDVQKEISRTLGKISSVEGRLLALREVGGKLVERGQGNVAVGIATELAAGGKAAAGAEGAAPPPVLKGQQVALLLALGKADQAAKVLPPPAAGAALDFPTRLGYAEGRAREGDFEKARELARRQPGSARDRLEASLGVAAVALLARRTEDAAANLSDAVTLLDTDLKGAKVHPLVLWQAARVAARVGPPEAAKALIARIRDPGCAARAELELLFRRIADNGAADAELVANKKTLAYAQALEWAARYNTRQGRREEVEQQAGQFEERHLRPFVYVGIALGAQDSHLPR
jgi:hypothetical protein